MKPIDNGNRRTGYVAIGRLPPDGDGSGQRAPSGLRVLFQRVHAALESLRERVSLFFGFSSLGPSSAAQLEEDDHIPAVFHVKSPSQVPPDLDASTVRLPLSLPRGSPVKKMRAFLFEPKYASQLAQRRPELQRKGLQGHIDFLSRLNLLRQADASAQSRLAKARTAYGLQFRDEAPPGSINRIKFLVEAIPEHIRKNFDEEIDDVLSLLDLDESIEASGLPTLLEALEQRISEDLLQKLSEPEDPSAAALPVTPDAIPVLAPSLALEPVSTADAPKRSADITPAEVSEKIILPIASPDSSPAWVPPPVEVLDISVEGGLFDPEPAAISPSREVAPLSVRQLEHAFTLLSHPDLNDMCSALAEKIGKNKIEVMQNFWKGLQALRIQFTVEAADQLKEKYIDQAGEQLNLDQRQINQFNTSYEAVRREINDGKSVGDTRLLDTFNPIETFVARQILNAAG